MEFREGILFGDDLCILPWALVRVSGQCMVQLTLSDLDAERTKTPFVSMIMCRLFQS